MRNSYEILSTIWPMYIEDNWFKSLDKRLLDDPYVDIEGVWDPILDARSYLVGRWVLGAQR